MNSPTEKITNWSELGFKYRYCPNRYSATFKDGSWGEITHSTEPTITLHEGATSLHYSQQCFEGMKANRAKDGRILLFRPELNCQRMNETATRLCMPSVPKELFISAIEKAVASNAEFIPPYGSNASLYIRPLLIGIGENIGVHPAPEYLFRVFVTPVSLYYKPGQLKPLVLKVAEADRAAPRGIGHFKAGSNYSPALYHQIKARSEGADDLLFLDPTHNRYIEEAGTANILVYFKDKTFATPKADTILPSITRRSAMDIAAKILKLKTEERAIDFYKEQINIDELASCGTAAVISPIGQVVDSKGAKFSFYDQGRSAGPVMSEIRNILTSIQDGSREDLFGWTWTVKT